MHHAVKTAVNESKKYTSYQLAFTLLINVLYFCLWDYALYLLLFTFMLMVFLCCMLVDRCYYSVAKLQKPSLKSNLCCWKHFVIFGVYHSVNVLWFNGVCWFLDVVAPATCWLLGYSTVWNVYRLLRRWHTSQLNLHSVNQFYLSTQENRKQ